MSVEDLSDEELDDVFFQMSIDTNIDLLDEMIKELEKKDNLAESEKLELKNKKEQLGNLIKIRKNGEQQN